MSEFKNALSDIIERSFQGNNSLLGKSSNIEATMISRLRNGKVSPSPERLTSLARVMNREDRNQLLLAAARDLVPAEFREDVFKERSITPKHSLPNDVQAILDYLAADCLRDDSTREYIRRIGTWVGVNKKEEPSDFQKQLKKVIAGDTSTPPDDEQVEETA